MPFDLFIWTGGVKTPEILLHLPLKTEPRGRLEANQTMACLPQTPDLELSCMIYGIGDNICSLDPKTNRPAPAVAPVALAQASIVTYNIVEDIKAKEGMGRAGHRIYSPASYPYVIPVGGKYAVAQIGPLSLKGIFGWLFKGVIELRYLTSIMPFTHGVSTWFKGFKVFIQNDQIG
jgi:NADH dehydrogenase